MKRSRILALDLDGTLLNSKKEISPLTLNALLQEEGRGAAVVLVSGRPIHGCAPFVSALRLKEFGGYVIAFNGAQILDCSTQQMLFQSGVPTEWLFYLHSLSRQQPSCALMTYSGEEVLTEDSENPYVQYAAQINRMSVRQVERIFETVKESVPKCIIAGEPEQLDKIHTESAARRTKLTFVRSEPFFLEIMPEGIDKGASLARLLTLIGAEASCVIAFGDSYNDATMLSVAGTSVAMGNARPEICAMADFTTASNDADGIASFLNTL